MLRCSEAAVCCSNFRCRSRPIRPPSSDAEIILARTPTSAGDQFRDPVAPARRNPELGSPPKSRPAALSPGTAPARLASRSILLRTIHTGAPPSVRHLVVLRIDSSTAPGRPPPRAPSPGARLPARPDRRSRESRRCRSPSPDSRRDRAAPRSHRAWCRHAARRSRPRAAPVDSSASTCRHSADRRSRPPALRAAVHFAPAPQALPRFRRAAL